ncbi:MAG: hypothetical protein ACYTAS_22505, partial [Planctomycetota bacterium]
MMRYALSMARRVGLTTTLLAIMVCTHGGRLEAAPQTSGSPSSSRTYLAIRVVDKATGRGVPL